MSQFKAWKCEDSLSDILSAIKVALTIQEIEKHDRSRIGEFMDAVSKAADGEGMEAMAFLALDFGLSDYVIAKELERVIQEAEFEEWKHLSVKHIASLSRWNAKRQNNYPDAKEEESEPDGR